MNAPLYERYRPRSWEELVGQDRVVRRVELLRQRGGVGGRAYWLAGQSGTGKTTIARLLASEIADDFNILEIDATGLSAAALVDLERQVRCFGLGEKSGQAIIINEAHGLNRAAVRQLLTTLERIPSHVIWLFTTTCEGQQAMFDGIDDSHPLLSRCLELPLVKYSLATAFAKRAQEIAEREGLGGRTLAAYLELLQKKKNNLRAVLQEIDGGAMLSV